MILSFNYGAPGACEDGLGGAGLWNGIDGGVHGELSGGLAGAAVSSVFVGGCGRRRLAIRRLRG